MASPEDAITAIFSLAVGVAVLALMRSAIRGGNVNDLASLISDLTIPFLFFLFSLYIALSIIEV